MTRVSRYVRGMWILLGVCQNFVISFLCVAPRRPCVLGGLLVSFCSLSRAVTFGFGSVIAPAGGRTTIAQSPQIVFNSGGMSVDSSGNPIGAAAIYIGANQGFFCAVTVSIAGQPATWEYHGATWKRK